MTEKVFLPEDSFSEVWESKPGLKNRLSTLHPYFAHMATYGLSEQMKSASLAEAAVWVGISVEAILSFVNCGAGLTNNRSEGDSSAQTDAPLWVDSLKTPEVMELDVRPVLAEGQDPFEQIMSVVHRLRNNDGFRLVAPFNPVPLRNVLAERGMTSYAEPMPEGGWVVYFHNDAPSDGSIKSSPYPLRDKTTDKVVHLDVRNMEPPQPLVEILTLIDGPSPIEEMFVRIHREPVFLFPELAERDWTYEVLEHRIDGDQEEFLLHLTTQRSAA